MDKLISEKVASALKKYVEGKFLIILINEGMLLLGRVECVES